ncbi:MAG TPA: efflux transporter outer membrane subunit [Steroidobacteraceae bacterium]|nr:efflux transporter outer membrane subunit [Steroidobacteraceae bacterium]
MSRRPVKPNFWRAALIGAFVAPGGCAVGPDYRTPQIAVPDRYEAVPAARNEAPLSPPQAAQADLSHWWRQFHDRQLDDLVQRALKSNLDLQVAASRIRQAREQEIVAGAARLPSVSATGLAARLHSNTNPLAGLGGQPGGSQSNGSSSASAGGPVTFDLYSIGFDATWEVDIFGGVRRGVEAARANTEAAAWQMRDAQVSLSAEVANTYLGLRTTQARLAIRQQSTRHQEELLQLTDARARNGFVTELDVNQQRTQLEATRAEIPELQAQERAAVHALGVLLGQEPDSLAGELAQETAVPAVPSDLPVGLPSELLRRRPDVRRAERQLAAATAGVGVAVADLYPKFNLLGALSLSASSPGQLLDGSSFKELGAGLVSWPLFAAGKLRANVHATEEQQTQAYLAYRKSVLVALQDAEDSLVRYTAEQRRLVSLRDSLTAAASSRHIAEEQYRAGMVTFIDVLTATNSELTAQDQVAQSTQALAQDLVSVYKALGGGWIDTPQ